jgi:DegV family protein with EDD domain
VDLTPEAFLRKLSTEGQVPATHPPSTGEILEAYRHVAASGDILGIYCSSKLSGSFENARLAVEEGRDELRALRVEAQVSSGPVLLTIDSGQCSGLLAMQVVFAVRLLRQGIEVQEVAERLGSIGGRQKSLLVVADPELVTGRGDLAAARAAAAGGRGRSLIRLGDGDLSVVARFDDPQAARVEAVRLLKDELAPDRPVFASLVHASAPADVAALQELVTSSFRVVELQQRQMGPAVTCHTGPGTVGVGLFQPTEEELELLRPQ